MKRGHMAEQKAVTFLKDDKVSLRPICKGDAGMVARWLNDPEVRRFIANRFPLSEAEEEKLIEAREARQPKEALLIVEVGAVPIGLTSLEKIDYVSGTAYTGSMIGEKEFWGKGYGTAAKILLLKFAFLELNLRKVYSHVLAYNGRSLKYAEKCGYKVEARLKEDRYKEGAYHDIVILSVYKGDFIRQFCS
jgi:RimJ/RimL family protein N-acetyltransferase